MKPPCELTAPILQLIAEISEKIGEARASLFVKASPELRKRNRIRTINASLAIEGNTLSAEQVTAIMEDKRVVGPEKDIREVSNAIRVYEQLNEFKPGSEKAFLAAHKILMQGLIPGAGKYRQQGAGIMKGKQMAHVAPPARNILGLMKDLFGYIKKSSDPVLIKSCVFHYETEFIHPFADGNGRMGRLWQTLLLVQQYPVFEYLPFETLVSKNQKKYYKALSISDKQGSSTVFIEFMLAMISESLDELLMERTGPVSNEDRIQNFLAGGVEEFTRKDYMQHFKAISSATASRDLKRAVEMRLVKKKGDKNKTIYFPHPRPK